MSTAFQIMLTGGQEVPANGSPATGLGTVVFDDTANTASYEITVWGLDWGPVMGMPQQTPGNPNDNVTILHVHNAGVGVNGPVVFGLIGPAQDGDDFTMVLNPDGSVTFSGVWETTDASGQPITNFSAGLGAAAVGAFMPLYFNVHTTGFPGGEVRGQWQCFATDNGEVLTGTVRGDILPGLGGDDEVFGQDGDDQLDGGTGADKLSGGRDDDTLVGGLGKDILQGNGGVDVLTGGSSRDKFVFNRISDSPAGGSADLVTDFNPAGGDVINVGKIDADTSTAGNQAFTIVAAFTGAGEQAVLTYLAAPDQTRLDLDNDNDGLADFSLLIDGNHTGSLGYVL